MPTNFEPTQNPALVNKIPFVPKIALPTIFGEALSYLEELGRVVKACNQTIEQGNQTVKFVNELAENVSNTISEYAELVANLQRTIDGIDDTLSFMSVLTSYKPIVYIGSETFPLADADLDLTPEDDMYTHDWSDTFILSDALVSGEPAFPFTDGTIVIDYATGYFGKCYINKGNSLCGITGLGIQLGSDEIGKLKQYSNGKMLVYKGDTAFPVPGEFMSFGLSGPLDSHDWQSEFMLPSGVNERPFETGTPVIDSRTGAIGVLTFGYDTSFNFKCGITGVSNNVPVFKLNDSLSAKVETTLVHNADGSYTISFNGQSTGFPHTFAPIISNIAMPQQANDATNKSYVDGLIPLRVNIVIDEDSHVGTMDKTFNEIATAITNGRLVTVKDSRCTLTSGRMSFVGDYHVETTSSGSTYYVTLASGAWNSSDVITFSCSSPSAQPVANYNP